MKMTNTQRVGILLVGGMVATAIMYGGGCHAVLYNSTNGILVLVLGIMIYTYITACVASKFND